MPAPATGSSPVPKELHSPLLKRQMPGLDALRGLAVLSVYTYHALRWEIPRAASKSPGVQLLSSLSTPGWLGVNLFFVLSGFLISGILIETRTQAHYWKNFYIRRVLRILPLYLVVLLILRLHRGVGWEYLLLCLLYLANFAQQMNVSASYGPLWSLAVKSSSISSGRSWCVG
jgi:peptidoglycan/LPS O-acetylase OafA/YrhL